MIDKIKSYINSNIGCDICFKLNNGRNQIDYFCGTILASYKSIFLIKIKNAELIRCFSYTDLLIGNLMVVE